MVVSWGGHGLGMKSSSFWGLATLWTSLELALPAERHLELSNLPSILCDYDKISYAFWVEIPYFLGPVQPTITTSPTAHSSPHVHISVMNTGWSCAPCFFQIKSLAITIYSCWSQSLWDLFPFIQTVCRVPTRPSMLLARSKRRKEDSMLSSPHLGSKLEVKCPFKVPTSPLGETRWSTQPPSQPGCLGQPFALCMESDRVWMRFVCWL